MTGFCVSLTLRCIQVKWMQRRYSNPNRSWVIGRRGDITRLFKNGGGGENERLKNPRLSKSGIGIFKEADYLRGYERRVCWLGEVKGEDPQ